MKILKNYEDGYSGNDCWIDDEVALIECAYLYLVLRATTYRGWMGTEPRYEEYQYSDYTEAAQKYEDIEKEIKRW